MEETKMNLVDWLDDLCVRFVINLPQEELESVERICFQIEEAQWFYEDFIRPLDSTLPSLPLRPFALRMFKHCPLLSQFSEEQHIRAFDEFLAYKTRVPVRGAILLNDAMDHVVLVKGWKKGSNWSFPRGKINKDEKDLDCAVREAYEETGYDLVGAGLAHGEEETKFLEATMREQHMKLFVFTGVPMDTPFAPRTRKEISKISWYKLSKLPGWHGGKHERKKRQYQSDTEDTIGANKLYMVAPFLQPLKSWINQVRRTAARKSDNTVYPGTGIIAPDTETDLYLTDERSALSFQPQIQYSARHEGPPVWQAFPQHTPHQFIDAQVQELKPSSVSGVEAASELKRLLSVGEPVSTNEQHGNSPAMASNGGSLLALLTGRQTEQSTALGQHSTAPTPRYPSERHPQMLDSPNHQHVRAPSMSGTRESPQFYYVTDSLPEQSQYSNHNRGQRVHAIGHGFERLDPFMYQSRPDVQEQGSWQRQQTAHQSIQPPPPYQRTGDPEFARPQQDAAQTTPSVPRASELPAPKLGVHAMTLLNMFKSGPPILGDEGSGLRPVRAAESSLPPRDELQAPQVTHSPHTTIPSNARSQLPSGDSWSRGTLGEAMSNRGVPDQNLVARTHPLIQEPAVPKPSSQQHALLELFRKPSAPLAPTPTATSGPMNVPEMLRNSASSAEIAPQSLDERSRGASPRQTKVPVQSRPAELSAVSTKSPVTVQPAPIESPPKPRLADQPVASGNVITTPGPKPSVRAWNTIHQPAELSAAPTSASATKQLFDPTDGKIKDHVPSPRVLARPYRSPPPKPETEKLPTATISGPMKTPDFGPVKQRSRHQKSESKSNKAEATAKAIPTPIQILKRPVTPKVELPVPHNAVWASTQNGSEQTATAFTSEQRSRALQPSPLLSPFTKAPKTRSRPTTPKATSAKPFAPQILRRPQEPKVAPLQHSSPSPDAQTAPKQIPTTIGDTDRQQTEIPKESLLSLYSEPTALPATTRVVPSPPVAQHEEIVFEKSTSPLPSSALDRKRSLVSLFGKSPPPSITTAPSPPVSHSIDSPSTSGPLQTQTSMAPADHREALLSLFSKPGISSLPNTTSHPRPQEPELPSSTTIQSLAELGTPSPIQALPCELPLTQPSRINSISSAYPSSARLNSFTPPFADTKPMASVSAAQQMNQAETSFSSTNESPAARSRVESRLGSHVSAPAPAPMSPTDRGFLLDYLAGFAKGKTASK